MYRAGTMIMRHCPYCCRLLEARFGFRANPPIPRRQRRQRRPRYAIRYCYHCRRVFDTRHVLVLPQSPLGIVHSRTWVGRPVQNQCETSAVVDCRRRGLRNSTKTNFRHSRHERGRTLWHCVVKWRTLCVGSSINYRLGKDEKMSFEVPDTCV